MKKRWFSILLMSVLFLGACGNSIQGLIAKKYPLKDTVQSSTNSRDVSHIYIAKGQSISQVAQYLQKQKTPKRVSAENNGKKVLIYDHNFVTLMKNKTNPNNTDIEVASYSFVRDNYQPSFFNGLFTGYLLGHLFGVPNWSSRQSTRCRNSVYPCYRGYTHSGGHYKGPVRPPSFRGSSSWFRGGGPNAGK